MPDVLVRLSQGLGNGQPPSSQPTLHISKPHPPRSPARLPSEWGLTARYCWVFFLTSEWHLIIGTSRHVRMSVVDSPSGTSWLTLDFNEYMWGSGGNCWLTLTSCHGPLISCQSLTRQHYLAVRPAFSTFYSCYSNLVRTILEENSRRESPPRSGWRSPSASSLPFSNNHNSYSSFWSFTLLPLLKASIPTKPLPLLYISRNARVENEEISVRT